MNEVIDEWQIVYKTLKAGAGLKRGNKVYHSNKECFYLKQGRKTKAVRLGAALACGYNKHC